MSTWRFPLSIRLQCSLLATANTLHLNTNNDHSRSLILHLNWTLIEYRAVLVQNYRDELARFAMGEQANRDNKDSDSIEKTWRSVSYSVNYFSTFFARCNRTGAANVIDVFFKKLRKYVPCEWRIFHSTTDDKC